MREILLSTQPKLCVKIASGEKKIEVRKTRPKEQDPFIVLLYCTKTNSEQALLLDKNGRLSFGDYRNASSGDYYIADGKVIGEFICDYIDEITPDYQFGYLNYLDLDSTCLTIEEINKYGNCKPLYAWHISNFKLYDKPKILYDFYKPCPTKEEYDCRNCEHFEHFEQGICTNYLTRPPQSWQYVLEKYVKKDSKNEEN